MLKVEYTDDALADLDEIATFLASYLDEDSVSLVIEKLYQEVQRIANLPFIGDAVIGLPIEYKRWLIYNRRYWIIFKRHATTFEVFRIWSTRRPFLQPSEILGS
jgi:plasmid stabilization system protein ParE